MKTPAFMSMPWDMVVFLTITTAGFGFSVQKLRSSEIQNERAVASVVDAGQTGTGQTLDFGCVERKLGHDRVNSQDGAIRVRGKFCHLTRQAMKSFDTMRVRNLTNGYEGTIFFHGYENAFSTDYVVLQTGKNLIQVEWRDTPRSEIRESQAEVFQK